MREPSDRQGPGRAGECRHPIGPGYGVRPIGATKTWPGTLTMPRCTFCNQDNPPGVRSCRSCGADVPDSSGPTPGSQDALRRRVRDLLAEGRKIEAIKLYREQT